MPPFSGRSVPPQCVLCVVAHAPCCPRTAVYVAGWLGCEPCGGWVGRVVCTWFVHLLCTAPAHRLAYKENSCLRDGLQAEPALRDCRKSPRSFEESTFLLPPEQSNKELTLMHARTLSHAIARSLMGSRGATRSSHSCTHTCFNTRSHAVSRGASNGIAHPRAPAAAQTREAGKANSVKEPQKQQELRRIHRLERSPANL